MILFDQTINVKENIYRDAGGLDMTYDEFREKSRKFWEKNINIYVLMNLKRKIKEVFVLVIKSKTFTFKVLQRRRLFD